MSAKYKDGILILVLNIDGTRNTTLSDMASGRHLAEMADKFTQNQGYPIPEPMHPVPGYVPPDKLGPNDTGGDQIPKPSEPLPGYQPLDPEQLGPNHTGGDQLVDKNWRDNALTAKGKELTENANELGYKQRISPLKSTI